MKLRSSTFRGVLGTVVMLCGLPTHAGVYKCLDTQQKVFYQDKPCAELKTARLPSHIAQLGNSSENRQFLWKATAPESKGEAYLLGSLHFGTKDMYPLPPKIMEAFNAADVLVVETNIDDPQEAESLKKLTTEGLYPEGASLEDHVKPGTWSRLLASGKALDIPEATLRQMKPWLVSLTLAQQALTKTGVDPSMGIDKAFVKDASTKKPIIQLESAAQQLKLLQNLSDLEQEQWLLQSIQDADKAAERYQELAAAWKKGDAEVMDLIVHRSFDSSPPSAKLFKMLFTDRNIAMANKIEEMTADGRKYFFVVGAGHLGGDQGIVKLLETKGFRIEQP